MLNIKQLFPKVFVRVYILIIVQINAFSALLNEEGEE